MFWRRFSAFDWTKYEYFRIESVRRPRRSKGRPNFNTVARDNICRFAGVCPCLSSDRGPGIGRAMPPPRGRAQSAKDPLLSTKHKVVSIQSLPQTGGTVTNLINVLVGPPLSNRHWHDETVKSENKLMSYQSEMERAT